MATKYRHEVIHVHTVDVDGSEFEVDHAVAEGPNMIAKKLPNGMTVVGYLSPDKDCPHPLDDCEGMGKIIDRRQNHGG